MEQQFIRTDQAPAPIGPYNQAVYAGNLLFISGQIALDAQSGELYNGDIEGETEKVMGNINAILKAADLNFSHIIKSTIFLTDMGQFSKVNDTYGKYFTGVYPARETVEVSALPKGVRVEISVIAYR